MDTIGNRIAYCIEKLDMKKIDFAKKLNVSSAFITQLTKGVAQPSDRTINDICDKFNVNEQWLRTGEGEMFRQLTRDEEIAAFLGSIIKEDENEFRKRLVSAMAKLDEKDWKEIERLANKLIKKD